MLFRLFSLQFPALVTVDGVKMDVIEMVKAVAAGSSLYPSDAAIDECLEWCKSVDEVATQWVCPLVGQAAVGDGFGQLQQKLGSLLHELEAKVDGKDFLVGQAATLADIAVGAFFFPLYTMVRSSRR